jgi:hypothetical protein
MNKQSKRKVSGLNQKPLMKNRKVDTEFIPVRERKRVAMKDQLGGQN